MTQNRVGNCLKKNKKTNKQNFQFKIIKKNKIKRRKENQIEVDIIQRIFQVANEREYRSSI